MAQINKIADEDRAELERLIPLARARAAKIGPLHAAWDVILDAEDFLNGKRTIVTDPKLLIELLAYGTDQENQ